MKQDKLSRVSLITLDITDLGRPSIADRKSRALDQRDVAIFCDALGLVSTDASRYDEDMDEMESVAGHC